ncbi:hypothetical protein MHZ93_14415 [Roseomonas sp. ACRSG]|jgi:hypothetical protein|nr:hypothetical protein [Roseomonas sp. ACRSG]
MPTTDAVGMAKKPLSLTTGTAWSLIVGSSAAPLPQCPKVQHPGRMPPSPQFGQHFFPALLAFMAGLDGRTSREAGAGWLAWA